MQDSPMRNASSSNQPNHAGDHIERDVDGKPAVVSNVPERQAVTGHNVRYVLLFSLLAAVIAFAALSAFHWQ
jgi:hypothetical protein